MDITKERSSPSPHRATISDSNSENNFSVDDLLDFSNDDATTFNNALNDNQPIDDSWSGSSLSRRSVVEPRSNDIGHQRFAVDHSRFSTELISAPCDDAAELEWLSHFVEEEPFSTTSEIHRLISSGESASTTQSGPTNSSSRPIHPSSLTSVPINHLEQDHNCNIINPIFDSDEVVSVPAKSRSKRSRVAPCSWATRLHLLSSTTLPAPQTQATVHPRGDEHHQAMIPSFPKQQQSEMKKKSGGSGKVLIKTTTSSGGGGSSTGGDDNTTLPMSTDNITASGMIRRCLHCATDRTPQWRTGPLGPKTLCNACGVRYKSGRLVPEYRPASSPTFVPSKHSNSHRKVTELRRKKEMMMDVGKQNHHHQQQQQQQERYDSNSACQEYNVHDGVILVSTTTAEEYFIHDHQRRPTSCEFELSAAAPAHQ